MPRRMKNLLLSLLLFLTFGCAQNNDYRTGQRFAINDPDLYMSIAPSFRKPYEFELKGEILIYSQYSGAGGYKWGIKSDIREAKLTPEQIKKIRKLSLYAIDSALDYEQGSELDIVLDGTFWYLQINFKSFVVATALTPRSFKFVVLENYLMSIMVNIEPNA